MARVVELIVTSKLAGTGKDDDPFRTVAQLFTLGGELVAECDAYPKDGDEPKSWWTGMIGESR